MIQSPRKFPLVPTIEQDETTIFEEVTIESESEIKEEQISCDIPLTLEQSVFIHKLSEHMNIDLNTAYKMAVMDGLTLLMKFKSLNSIVGITR